MINKGIIFDLDGTLWDTSEVVTASWNIALDRCGDIDYKITVQDMHNLMGLTLEEIAYAIFPSVSKQRAMDIMKECVREEDLYIQKYGGILYPELEETLKELSLKYGLFIVSNCQNGYIENFLNFHDLGKYFLDFECAGRTKKQKGENIKLVVERNNLDKAVYVGDTQLDYYETEFAGIPFIHAKYGFGKVNEKTYFINEISELPILISGLL